MNRTLLAFVFALVACEASIQSGLDSAQELSYRQEYVESERLYRKQLKRLNSIAERSSNENRQRLSVLDSLGKLNALYLHDYPQAITFYQTLVRDYPKTDEAFAARATVADIFHHKMGKLEAAIDEYQKLIHAFPKRDNARGAQLSIANAYFELKNYTQARTEAEKLVSIWPQSQEAIRARFHIANSYYVEGRYSEAIASYETILQQDADDQLRALVFFELGNCYQALGDSGRALQFYFDCLPHHPNPLLVQRKIKRVRSRMRKTAPSSIHASAPRYSKPAVVTPKPTPTPKPAPAAAPAPKPVATPKPPPAEKPQDILDVVEQDLASEATPVEEPSPPTAPTKAPVAPTPQSPAPPAEAPPPPAKAPVAPEENATSSPP